MAHIPFRMCVACRNRKEQSQLFRITVCGGMPVIDDNPSRVGRGAYICRDAACIKKARKKHIIERNLKCVADDKIYEIAEGLV